MRRSGVIRSFATTMHWRRFFWPVGAVFGALAGMAIIYLGYDVLKDRASPCDQANSRRIDLERTVGQMIVVGFFGTNDSAPGFRRVLDDLEHDVIGGVLFLGRNVASRSELETMVERIVHCKCSAPPLIAIDEEGGMIERLGKRYGFDHTPSAAEIGRDSTQRAQYEYNKLARKLSGIGFNMNLAPVVDVNKNINNPIIGSLDRSFSQDPSMVRRYAEIFIEEHRKLNILTTLKHFPGHGSSSTDTHAMIADVENSWSPEELIPYQHLINAGLVDSIMVGHLANSKEWGGVATQVGSTAISRILRKELGFDGVVLSDDLSMESVRLNNSSFAEVIKSAVLVGADVVIVGRPATEDDSIDVGCYANSALVEGITSDEIDGLTIAETSQRIKLLKRRLSKSTALSWPESPEAAGLPTAADD